MERKGIPLTPFIVVALVIVLFEKYHSHLPDFIPSKSQPNTSVSGPICANYREKSLVFDRNCSACHFLDKDMSGPALKGSLYDESFYGWFELFLTSEDSLEQANDSTTIQLIRKWRSQGWRHNFDSLTKTEMDELRALTW